MIPPETEKALRPGLISQRDAADWGEAAGGRDLLPIADVHYEAFYVCGLQGR